MTTVGGAVSFGFQFALLLLRRRLGLGVGHSRSVFTVATTDPAQELLIVAVAFALDTHCQE